MQGGSKHARGSTGVPPTRIKTLADADVKAGTYVLYWMQQSQRAEYNHALELAVQLANELRKPLVVGFGLFERYPDANARHFTFLLEGLRETCRTLAERGIRLVVRRMRPDELALELGKDACAIVCDRGYLRHQREWRRNVAARAGKLVLQVESDVLVPVDVASNKAEYAAYTLRPKLHRLWPTYLVPLERTALERESIVLKVAGLDLDDPTGVLNELDCDRGVAPVATLRGGSSQARALLERFLANTLAGYTKEGKRPENDQTSKLGPYLHFGQISPLEIALAVDNSREAGGDNAGAFLEELLVRRELGCNFVENTPKYDAYTGAVPRWAQATLAEHASDPRPHAYTKRTLEAARTHDPYWNMAMREMRDAGFLHNYMRMYWGKKILEWSATPEAAFETTLALNNKYFLCGRDPNAYTNVAWLFGLHDRPWFERPIFGKVRYMAASGLERKFDMDAYLAGGEERIAAALTAVSAK